MTYKTSWFFCFFLYILFQRRRRRKYLLIFLPQEVGAVDELLPLVVESTPLAPLAICCA